MSNVITGQVAHINQPYTNTQGYTNQTIIVLVEPGQYQSYVEITVPSAKSATLLRNVQVNGHYNFHVNIRGSKQIMQSTKVQGQGVAFNNISVWKIEPQGVQAPAPQQGGFQAPPYTQQTNNFAQPQQQQPQQFHNAPAQVTFNANAPQQPAFNNAPQTNPFQAPQQGGFIGGNGNNNQA